ncbi:CDP-alcohol phosphatidyltransferase-domain-containing protein [Trichophaea hybrida]|nr:CDP-alcohol phosphatidyltransferase-domain-containing protein [Trichophaea hybrida]
MPFFLFRTTITTVITTQHALFRTSPPCNLSDDRGDRKQDPPAPLGVGHLSPTKQTIRSIKSKILPLTTPHENIYNFPNALTFTRLLSSPVIGYLILHDQHSFALSLFALAGVTDLVDGYIARRWNLQTVVGSVIDPMADKTLMTILTVCLAIKGLLPVWIAVVILGRDVALAISAIYFRWISLPPPKTMARYWDFSLPSAEVHPTTISKLNTALQLGLIGACMASPLIGASGEWEVVLQAMQYTVATTTVWSGLSYVFSKDAVKILKHPAVPVEKEEDLKG